ncbi:hypothetical protein RB195_017501 [Necator americanus]|uniref:VWFA domain-containing protein n=1 Tax=Necator americanus TaxID=51031 RepID=A0ABR1C5I3_NECAM
MGLFLRSMGEQMRAAAAKIYLLLFLLFALHYPSSASEEPDATFKRFCANPPNGGSGRLDEKTMQCEVTYNVISSDETAAYKFCDMQHPFSLVKAVAQGPRTLCSIRTFLKCEITEVLISETCYLHSFEQKWITAFMTEYNMIWIGNNQDQLNGLIHKTFPGKVLNGASGRLISGSTGSLAILTRKGSASRLRAGVITKADSESLFPILCSRNADQYPSYITSMIERLNELGISSSVFTDRENRQRAFALLRSVVEFEMKTAYDTGTQRHHKVCKGFKNGFAATPLDFQNVNDFKNFLKKEKVNIVSVPGRRLPSDQTPNLNKCDKDPRYQSARQQFVFDLPTGVEKKVPNEYWRPEFPTRTCADTPRIALGFSQEGLVDVPAIARMLLVCTFGAPISIERTPDDDCHYLAHYNKAKGACECNDPNADILVTKLIRRSSQEESLKPGTLCLDCEANPNHHVFVVFDLHSSFKSLLKSLMKTFYVTFATRHTTVILYANGHPFMGQFACNPANVLASWKMVEQALDGVPFKDQSNSGAPEVIAKADEYFADLATTNKVLVLFTGGYQNKQGEVKSVVDKIIRGKVDVVTVGTGKATTEELQQFRPAASSIFPNANSANVQQLITELTTKMDRIFVRNECVPK